MGLKVLSFILIPIVLFIINSYRISYLKMKRKSIEDWYIEVKNRKNYCPLNRISPVLITTIILLEDHNYFSHKGYDLYKIYKALYYDIKMRAKEFGGSTITQQLAKNLYFSFRKTFTRKFAEIFIALKLEEKLTKEQILELYLNIIDYGEGLYNITDACNYYFHKQPNNITINEAITLGCLLPNPEQYQPLNKNGYFSKARHKALVTLNEIGFFRNSDFSMIEHSKYDDVLKIQEAFIYEELYRISYIDMISKRKLPNINISDAELSHLFSLTVNNYSLVKHVLNCRDENTKYVYGGLMEEINKDKILELADLYPDFYTKQKTKELLQSEGALGCDCSGLIKSFFFSYNRKYYHQFLDRNSYMMLDIAKHSGNIDTLPELPGICLEMPGHVGIYLGNGSVIESTSNKAFGDGIVTTNLLDRKWNHWFSCYFIYYKELEEHENSN